MKTAPHDPILTDANPAGDARLMAAVAEACPACDQSGDPLVALGPDSTDLLSPPRVTADAAKTSATAGAGSPDIPMVAMAQTDDAITRGERCDISIALAAERRAWIVYADSVARVIPAAELLAALLRVRNTLCQIPLGTPGVDRLHGLVVAAIAKAEGSGVAHV